MNIYTCTSGTNIVFHDLFLSLNFQVHALYGYPYLDFEDYCYAFYNIGHIIDSWPHVCEIDNNNPMAILS